MLGRPVGARRRLPQRRSRRAAHGRDRRRGDGAPSTSVSTASSRRAARPGSRLGRGLDVPAGPGRGRRRLAGSGARGRRHRGRARARRRASHWARRARGSARASSHRRRLTRIRAGSRRSSTPASARRSDDALRPRLGGGARARAADRVVERWTAAGCPAGERYARRPAVARGSEPRASRAATPGRARRSCATCCTGRRARAPHRPRGRGDAAGARMTALRVYSFLGEAARPHFAAVAELVARAAGCESAAARRARARAARRGRRHPGPGAALPVRAPVRAPARRRRAVEPIAGSRAASASPHRATSRTSWCETGLEARSAADLVGLRVGLNGRDSLSGYVLPHAALSERGLGDALYDDAIETGSHRRSLELLVAGELDAARDRLDAARARGADDPGARGAARARAARARADPAGRAAQRRPAPRRAPGAGARCRSTST